jgi:predicted metalloprotease
MRFNPKARLDTSRVRDAGRGRGGGGLGGAGGSGFPIPGGARAGGGLGGVIIVILFLVLTQCVGGGGGGLGGAGGGSGSGLDTSRMADTGRYEQCRSGADANSSSDCARVAVENSLADYWEQTLPDQSGTSFSAEQAVETFSGSVGTGCGQATADVGPFYCPSDRSIYLDTTFFDAVLQQQLDGPSGDFVEPYVLAHEYGHHIQNLLGTMGQVKTQQGPTSDSVRLELQADCYAGMWTKNATSTDDASGQALIQSLSDQDIRQAIDAATAVGDDRIQSRSGGRVNPEQWTHGSSAERVKWFQTGYTTGDLAACDTFGAHAL